jgi:hypothetical protein
LKIPEGMEEYDVKTGLCLAQMFGHVYIPNAELVWKYVHGDLSRSRIYKHKCKNYISGTLKK